MGYLENDPTNSSYRCTIFATSGTGPDPYQVSKIGTPDRRDLSHIQEEVASIFNPTNNFLNKLQFGICNR